MGVLLLNATFEPLDVVSARRAVVLIITGKALPVERGDGVMRSPSVSVPIPAVIRLLSFVRLPAARRTAPLTRRTLTARDQRRCQVAGCRAEGSTVDHVVPRSRGGRHTWGNVVLMCAAHNQAKGHRLLAELGWKLKQRPRAPVMPHIVLAENRADVWEPYLRAFAVG